LYNQVSFQAEKFSARITLIVIYDDQHHHQHLQLKICNDSSDFLFHSIFFGACLPFTADHYLLVWSMSLFCFQLNPIANGVHQKVRLCLPSFFFFSYDLKIL
jgi:hypothetical protein